MPSNTLYSFPVPLTTAFPPPVVTTRAPLSTDYLYPIGQEWIDSTGMNAYFLVSVVANSATWAEAYGVGSVDTLTGDSGGAIAAVAANISILGTAHQITSIGTAGTITLSLIGPYAPATYTAHGVLVGEGTGSIVAATAGSNGQVLLGSTTADPAFGTITSTTGIGFTTGAASLAINAINGAYLSVNQTSTPVNLVKQNSYINSNAVGQMVFTLPLVANASQGNVYQIIGSNAGGWTLTQNATQIIHMGAQVSTTGVNGSVSANSAFCSLTLTCIDAGLNFVVTASSGTFTVI